ncbi:hypothetical protein [Streptomyces sp. NPDC088757]|uniref:hypothetical protein n=1 Tax=Streptomyces sp. NPDC088757 TaxID=3365889 RepID=UPI0037FF45A4
MPVDPFAVLHALMRAEASRARRTARTASEPGAPAPESAPAPAPAPAPEPPTSRNEPVR